MADPAASPAVSVVVPARDAARHLATQLSAISADLTGVDGEVLVVDNGSTDATAAIVRQFAARDPRFRLIVADGPGSAARARNVGAHHARGELLLFCDADDEVRPGWAATMAAAARRADVVVGALEYERLNGPHPAPWVPRPVDLHTFCHLGFHRSGSTANLAIGRARFLRLGGFDDRLRRATSEDVDLCWRAQLSGATLVHEPSAVVSYRAREHLAEAVRQSFGYGQADAFLYRKFAPHGLRRPSLTSALRWWAASVAGVGAVRDRRRRALWARDLAYRIGRVSGSVRYRVLVP